MKKLTNKADSRLYIMVPDEMLKEASYAYKINGDVYPVDDWVLSDVKDEKEEKCEKESTFSKQLELYIKAIQKITEEDKDNRTVIVLWNDNTEPVTTYAAQGYGYNIIRTLAHALGNDHFRSHILEALSVRTDALETLQNSKEN